MDQFAGRVAVVTGAASGIGFALAQRFAAEGMRVVLADIEALALARADEELRGQGARTLAVQTDVSVWEDVAALAGAAHETFGAVHVLCNNAGVAGAQVRTGGIWERDLLDWQWLLGVNVWGVIHGVRAFLPRMLAAGSEGHIVNTASLAGITPSNSIYSVTKHAVVAISEALSLQLRAAKANVGVSVLCPGLVKTNILDAARNRPARLQPKAEPEPAVEQAGQARRRLEEHGMEPEAVAEEVLAAIRAGRFYVIAVQEAFRDRIASAVLDRAQRIVGAEHPRG